MTLREIVYAKSLCKDTQQCLGHPGVLSVEWSPAAAHGTLWPIELVTLRIHGLAHSGIRVTIHMLTARNMWHDFSADVAAWFQYCQVPCDIFSHVYVDLVGPLTVMQAGCTHMYTVVDLTTW